MSVGTAQHIIFNFGGTLSIDLPELSTEEPVNYDVEVIRGNGSTLIAKKAATISTIDTNLAAVVSADALTITVDATTGFGPDAPFYIGDDSNDTRERCIQKGPVVGSTITLWRPLFHAHIDNAVVKGVRLTASVSAAEAVGQFWDGRVTWYVDDVPTYHQLVTSTKYPMARLATLQNLYDEIPKLKDHLDKETDAERLLERGMNEIIDRLSQPLEGRVWSFTAADQFIELNSMAAAYLHYRSIRDFESKSEYDSDITAKLRQKMSLIPRDADGDGAISKNERRSYSSAPRNRG